ncbi:MAG TPA: CpsB/CapC family capsule biosynthesis tyrosine phosphatase [bacterium]
MYDLHNHVLPGVDDGAVELRVALRMLEIAAKQGITHVACTPHSDDRADSERDRLFQSVFSHVKEAAKQRQIPVELILASELMVGAGILKVLALPSSSFGGKGKYCLIEFPIETPFEIIQNVVKAIRRQNIHPVLAHYERFSRAQRTMDQPQALRDAGAVLTLDAGSILGQFGNVLVKRSKQLLAWNVVDILTSDAHDDGSHGFCLQASVDATAAIVGLDATRKMVVDNPRRVWEGLPWPTDHVKGGAQG